MNNLKILTKNKTPVWFMRQAGRYLPEYRKIRKKEKNFIDLCFNSELAAEISLQPIRRFNFDFIILFSDILVVPYALGQKVDFKESIGPVLKKISCFKDFEFVNVYESIEKLNPIMNTIKILKKEKKSKNLIGFCGGPFTVLTYMFEGGTSKTHGLIKKKIKAEREDFKKLLDFITEISILYLKEDITKAIESPNYIKIKDRVFIESDDLNDNLNRIGKKRSLTSGLAIIKKNQKYFSAAADSRRDGTVRGN